MGIPYGHGPCGQGPRGCGQGFLSLFYIYSQQGRRKVGPRERGRHFILFLSILDSALQISWDLIIAACLASFAPLDNFFSGNMLRIVLSMATLSHYELYFKIRSEFSASYSNITLSILQSSFDFYSLWFHLCS